MYELAEITSINPYTPNKGTDLRGTLATHIFFIRIDTFYPRLKEDILHGILTADERSKALRYFQHKDQARYLSTRVGLRLLLSDFLDITPAEIIFKSNKQHKPLVEGVKFSVTHSGNYVAIAVASSELGIDMEFINLSIDVQPIMSFVCAADEIEHIQISPQPAYSFYQIWTRKEALLKATGEGLTNDLQQVSCIPTCISRRQRIFYLDTFRLRDEYMVSLASEKQLPVYYWDFDRLI